MMIIDSTTLLIDANLKRSPREVAVRQLGFAESSIDYRLERSFSMNVYILTRRWLKVLYGTIRRQINLAIIFFKSTSFVLLLLERHCNRSSYYVE